MKISKDLFLAILSMDAYDEGHGAGVQLPGTQQGATLQVLGNATVLTNSSLVLRDPITNQPLDQPAGLYAIAYTVGASVDEIAPGTVTISYRGTDDADGRLVASSDVSPLHSAVAQT